MWYQFIWNRYHILIKLDNKKKENINQNLHIILPTIHQKKKNITNDS